MAKPAADRDQHTLHHGELVCPAAAHSDVPDKTLLYDPMKSLHCLFDRGVVVESMALEHIDIVESKPL